MRILKAAIVFAAWPLLLVAAIGVACVVTSVGVGRLMADLLHGD